jgi:hypothetical protein
MEHMSPGAQVSIKRIQPRATRSLGADPGIVYQSIDAPADLGLDRLDCGDRLVRIGKVDLDMVRLAPRPGATRVEGLARAGQDPPPFRRKALDRSMADPAAGPGEDEGRSWRVPAFLNLSISIGNWQAARPARPIENQQLVCDR